MGCSWKACSRALCLSLVFWFPNVYAALDKVAAEGLSAAVTIALIGTPNAPAMRAEFHKVAFLRQGTAIVAIVIAKSASQDCAATTISKPAIMACSVLVLEHISGHRWKFHGSMPFGVYPLAVRSMEDDRLEFYTTTSTEVAATHQRVLLTANGLATDPSARLSTADVDARAFWKIDDRNTPLLETVVRVYADGSRATLAPARILADSTNVNLRLQNDQDHESVERSLLIDLKLDLSKVAATSEWPQMLDVRIRRCDDWMVPRQFWRTEGRRLAQIGFCSDPIVFARKVEVIKSQQQASAIARLLLFDDIGAAYVLRTLRIPQDSKQRLALGSDERRFARIAAGVGALIANQGGVQTFAQRDAAYDIAEAVINAWYVAFEAGQGWTEPSPELARFYILQAERRAGLACVRAVQAGTQAPGVSCDAEMRAIFTQARKELTRS